MESFDSAVSVLDEKTVVERVARAMWEVVAPNNPWETALDDDYYDGPGRNWHRAMARTAIKAYAEAIRGSVE